MKLAEIMAAAWAITAQGLEGFAGAIEEVAGRGEVAAAMARSERFARSPRARAGTRVAILSIKGPILRGRERPFLSMWGIEHTGQEDVRDGLRAAVEDPSVEAIMLDVDSPGGIAQGLERLASELRAAGEVKPLHAYVSGQATSAAYYLASQASSITAEPDATVGSIGVYSVAVDSSKAAEKRGVSVHVIRSGPHKGMGIPGAPITDEQLAMHQRLIDGLARGFVEAVADGRGMSSTQVRTLATGAHWIAREGLDLGLVDRVGSLDDALTHLGEAAGDDRKEPHMSGETQTQTNPKAATLAELRGEFPEASSDFLLGQLEAGATLVQASKAYAKLCQEDAAKARAEAAQAKADADEARKAAAAKTDAPRGTTFADPSRLAEAGDSEAEDEDVEAGDFMQQARDLAHTKSWKLTRAMSYLSRTKPGLHADYVEAQRAAARKPRRRRS